MFFINFENYYKQSIIPTIILTFNSQNKHTILKLQKICINSGLGILATNEVYLSKALTEFATIAIQYPYITQAHESISEFKIKKHSPIGLSITLRKQRMYAFLEKLILLTFPQIRAFNGFNLIGFDTSGNYNLGLNDHKLFPDIDTELVDKTYGLNISIIFTRSDILQALFILTQFHYPFKTEIC